MVALLLTWMTWMMSSSESIRAREARVGCSRGGGNRSLRDPKSTGQGVKNSRQPHLQKPLDCQTQHTNSDFSPSHASDHPEHSAEGSLHANTGSFFDEKAKSDEVAMIQVRTLSKYRARWVL